VSGQGGPGPFISLQNAYRIEQQAVFGRGAAKLLAWSPNGKQLAVGSTAGIWLYDPNDFDAPPHRLETSTDVVDMAYSPDGTRLAVVSEGGAVVMWDAVTGARFEILDFYQIDSDHRVAFSADSKVLAVQYSPPMRLWDVETREEITSLVTKVPEDLGISRIPYSVVTEASDSAWTLTDTATNDPQPDDISHLLEGYTLEDICVDPSADNMTLVSGSQDGSIRLWNAATGKLLLDLNEQWGDIQSMAFSPDCTLLASATESKVRLWNPVTGDIVHTFEGYSAGDSFFGGAMLAVAYSPDGTTLAGGEADNTISLWDISAGQQLNVLYGHVAPISSLAYSPDGTLLASGSYDQTIRLWDTKTGETRQILLKDAESMITDVAFNPDGTLLVAATYSPNVLVWDVNTGVLLHELGGHTGLITSVAFSPDGTVLASGSLDTTIRLWDMTSYTSLAVLSGHDNTVTDVAFNSAGDRLASTSTDGMVRMWSVPEGIPVNAISAEDDNTQWGTAAFNQDGSVLIAGGSWGAMQLWKSDTGVQIADLSSYYMGTIRDIAISPLGNTIATADTGGVVRLWGIPAEQTALRSGGTATIHVIGDDTLNVRDVPGLESTVFGILTDGMKVIIRDGPQASDGYTWWQVETPAGSLGWVVESADGIPTLVP
jgi:WD40 repeat protein